MEVSFQPFSATALNEGGTSLWLKFIWALYWAARKTDIGEAMKASVNLKIFLILHLLPASLHFTAVNAFKVCINSKIIRPGQ
jgi:hypothetical protein